MHNYEIIEKHELVHAKQRHYYDLVFFQMLKIIFWINPAVYLFQISIKLIHEFIADQVASQGLEIDYAKLLLTNQFGTSITNVFYQSFYNQSLIKSRITMLLKNKSPENAKNKIWLLMPVLLLFLSCNLKNENPNLLKVDKIAKSAEIFNVEELTFNFNKSIKIIPKVKEENKILKDKDFPEYPGGIGKMYEFLGLNIRYPKEAEKAKIEGRIYAKFSVNTNGSISNVKILKGLGYGYDQELVRVLNEMPKWQPAVKNGNAIEMEYNIPVNFKLALPSSNLKEPLNMVKEGERFVSFFSDKSNYDIFVNGKLTPNESVKNINMDKLKFVRVKRNVKGKKNAVYIELNP